MRLRGGRSKFRGRERSSQGASGQVGTLARGATKMPCKGGGRILGWRRAPSLPETGGRGGRLGTGDLLRLGG